MHDHLGKLPGKSFLSSLLSLINLAFNCSDFGFKVLIHLHGVDDAQALVEMGAFAELLTVLTSLAIFKPPENVLDCIELLNCVGHSVTYLRFDPSEILQVLGQLGVGIVLFHKCTACVLESALGGKHLLI